jgi:hypothetical protein
VVVDEEFPWSPESIIGLMAELHSYAFLPAVPTSHASFELPRDPLELNNLLHNDVDSLLVDFTDAKA